KTNLHMRTRIEDKLIKALESQKKVAAARQWVTTLSADLTVAELARQASAMMSGFIDRETSDKLLKSQSLENLDRTLFQYEEKVSKQKETHEDSLKTIEIIEQNYIKLIIDTSKRNGAPDDVIVPML